MGVLVACLVTACTSAGKPDPPTAHSPSAHSTTARPSTEPESTSIRAPDLAAIRRTISAINATAGGPVAAQRRELDRLAAPGQRTQQKACPAAHSTLAFQPAYDDLRQAPPDTQGFGGTGSAVTTAGSPSSPVTGTVDADGAAYLLPSFITIYTGDRITGTDLTTLRLWVTDGTARTGALCVS